MGKLAELGTQSREGYLRNPERLSQNLKDIGRKAEPWKRLATEGFGQIMFGDEGTIPWYMSLAPGADLTDKLMEGRQPGLLDIPGPGTLGKFAMLPIAKFGAKGILKGTARMGKTPKNLKHLAENDDVVTRYHRTLKSNEQAIDKEGLKIVNKNRGKNTADISNYPPVTFLANNPVNIPVLRRFEDRPDLLTTYEVRIPKEEYWATPRIRFKGGRGGKPEIAPRGKESWTDEGDYKIDTFGKDIPPSWLHKMDQHAINDQITTDRLLTDIRRFTVYGPDDYGNENIGRVMSRFSASNPKRYNRFLGDQGWFADGGSVPPWDMDGIYEALEEAAIKPQLDRSSVRDFTDYYNIKDRYKSNDGELQYVLKEISNRLPPRGKHPQNPYLVARGYLKKLPENRTEYWKPGKIPDFNEPDKITKMPRANAMGSISRGDPIAAKFDNHKLKHLMAALKDPNNDRSLILPHIKDYLRKQSESVIH